MSSAPFLKSQDIVVACDLVLSEKRGHRDIARDLRISLSTVYASLVRLREARLVSSAESGSDVARDKFLDLLVHAVPTIFFPRLTGIARGILTGASAPVFGEENRGLSLVWPYAHGRDSGEGLVPIYPSVPIACVRNQTLYDFMSAVEVLRTGRWQEKNVATAYLEKILGAKRVKGSTANSRPNGVPTNPASEADTKVEGIRSKKE